MFFDSGLGTTISGKSRYADHISSAASHTSFISTNADGDTKAARVPQMPVEVGLGLPFRCIYCGYNIHHIKNRQDWK